ncbi:MAG TPA: hypothetical protein VLF69_06010 [Candidatus Saccharimonadales bacterium]|nr:hypothetical protein [Candidatus Saccharimonadales bacterium]
MITDWDIELAILRHHVALNLHSLQVESLPISVCGLLSSLLPATQPLARLRADLARSLRERLKPDWLQTTELAAVCAALDGMHAYDSSLVTGSDMAMIIERLLAAESAAGGPYYDSDGSLQASTNACIDQCLRWLAQPLPGVSRFLADFEPFGQPASITKAERTVLICLQASTATGLPFLVQQVRQHSELLIAALMAGVVATADKALSEPSGLALEPFASTVHTLASEALVTRAEPFTTKTRAMLELVAAVDSNHEIAGLAAMYAAVQPRQSSSISAKLLSQLGIANVYAWGAYTIYDDFLDDEGDPTLLATGNHLLRAMVRMYGTALPALPDFQSFVEQTLTTIDAANTRETSSLRFTIAGGTITIGELPDYGEAALLADRALFHITGPMGVLAAGGEPVNSPTWQATLEAFRHYLIARQLNDDVHDWVADLQAGQASYVVVALLRHLGVTPGSYTVAELLPYARQLFWQEVLPAICDYAIAHVIAARQLPVVDQAAFTGSHLNGLFDRVEGSMRAAKADRNTGYELLQQLHFTR